LDGYSDGPLAIITGNFSGTTPPWENREPPMTRSTSDQKWQQQSEQAKSEAAELPPGKEREVLLRKARQLEVACHLNDWISSPGLKPPK
jgi:hypothetical protein